MVEFFNLNFEPEDKVKMRSCLWGVYGVFNYLSNDVSIVMIEQGMLGKNGAVRSITPGNEVEVGYKYNFNCAPDIKQSILLLYTK